jgi:Helix-turn-helix domain
MHDEPAAACGHPPAQAEREGEGQPMKTRTRRQVAQSLLALAGELMEIDGQEETKEEGPGPGPGPAPGPASTASMEEGIKAPAAARLLGISEDTLRMLAAREEIPHYWIPSTKGKGRAAGGRDALRFLPSEIDRWRRRGNTVS